MEIKDVKLTVREFDIDKDIPAVEDLEKRCETTACSKGKMSLFTDLLGDPICRIRHSPSFLMLVAEINALDQKEMVGIIRGCIKTVTCGKKFNRANGIITTDELDDRSDHRVNVTPICTKLAYILGLRVSPFHRRKGIGSKLIDQMEDWFRKNGAGYSYMATELDNIPSLNLFTKRCHYTKFRTPSILVQPVFAHRVRTHSNRVTIIKLSPADAEALYRRRFSATEFFPHDIDRILRNKLNLGTYVGVPYESDSAESWPGSDQFLSYPPESWAVISMWNCKEAFTLEIKGASFALRLAAKATRVVDGAFPWLRIPSVPDVFRPFGVLVMYGLGGEGPHAGRIMKALCGHAHNMGMELRCGVLATEMAREDPLRLAIPHWNRLSCAEDVWCVKRLAGDYGDGPIGDWTKSSPGPSIFVDPREF